MKIADVRDNPRNAKRVGTGAEFSPLGVDLGVFASGMAGPRDVLVFREPAPPAPALALADSFLRQGAPNTNEGAKEFAQLGGLVSYGASLRWLNVRAADFVAKILRGAKPAELPVEHPTRFELVINLKTAKTLGLRIPPSVLARATEVIQ